MKIAKHCIVKGRVQGVFYRHSTQVQALELGLTGWVCNLPNGDVECVICGEKDVVDQMCEWLKKGPPAAKVTEVQMQDVPWQEHSTFVVRR